jgi:hypothetical protein
MCVDGGQRCFALGVPEAAVTLESDNGTVAEAKSDPQGVAHLKIAPNQQPLKLVATSPLLNGGSARTELPASDHGDSTSINVIGALSDQARAN